MTRIALATLLLACLAESGCFDISWEFDHGPVREDRGPLLADDVVIARGTGSTLAFTADGAEVVYVARGRDDPSSLLRAVAVADGTTRVLDGARPASGMPLAATPDGSALYYFDGDERLGSGGVPPTFEVREAFSGARLSPTRWWIPTMLVASPSGRRLLVSDAYATVLLDLDTGEATESTCSDPAVFSPASDAVLCAGAAGPSGIGLGLSLVPLAGQVPPPLVDVPHDGSPAALSWSEHGMRVAFSNWKLVVGDPATGRVLLDRGVDLASYPMAFTPDGAALAYIRTECRAGAMFGCTRLEWQLVVVEVATGQERTIASSADQFLQMAISPDGKTIAYVVDAELHVRPTGW